ncbi:MAG: hypothetical protein UY48_C0038G0006 [Candidatus Gottesmanbacteria bacterium GW2011_GWB1_49_7]|uniref:Uncharacterized protein n=1 Tax=Candidatus Gottesmanbacteria bacterium GW2011_GWB1_49_7 TaxID=1618448 RepID=A0A0G1VVB7_9BACT|nr:MAG: hypothetical protein UY48_C0038G0006 [Candidatus Gottesmanbacteria bacterium GW2011_GWB1_49_7]
MASIRMGGYCYFCGYLSNNMHKFFAELICALCADGIPASDPPKEGSTWANREVNYGDILLRMRDGTPLLAEAIGHSGYRICDGEGPLSMQALTHHFVNMACWEEQWRA